MLEKITNKIVKQLIENKVIDNEDYDIYYFGIYQCIGFAFNIITSVFIFLLFDMVIEGIIFSISYFVLRSYAGGFHNQSTYWCYIMSILLIFLSVMFMKYVNLSYVLWIVFFTAIFFIYVYAPVDTKNKRLDEIERKMFRLKSRMILVLLVVMALFFYFSHFFLGTIAIMTAILVEGAMLITGILKNNIDCN